MLTALVFALMLTTAVVVHELAHYLNARSVGVPVRAFSVGIGPVLARWHWRGTEWRLSLLPLGGYVDLPGMAPEPDEDGTLRHPRGGMAEKRWLAKIWVLIGGVIANFLLGIVLLASAVQLDPTYRQVTAGVAVDARGARIVEVADGSPAEGLDLRAGDVVLEINGVRDPTVDVLIEQLRATEGTLRLTVASDGEAAAARSVATPWPPADAGDPPLLGVSLRPLRIDAPRVSWGTALAESAVFGVTALPEMAVGFVRGFGSLLVGGSTDDVAGPVGMVSLTNRAAQAGLAPVLLLAALINFSLAVFNLLPIPGLDGGRIVMTTIVALRGRPFRPGQEEAVHFAGILAVISLMVLITIRELGGLLGG